VTEGPAPQIEKLNAQVELLTNLIGQSRQAAALPLQPTPVPPLLSRDGFGYSREPARPPLLSREGFYSREPARPPLLSRESFYSREPARQSLFSSEDYVYSREPSRPPLLSRVDIDYGRHLKRPRLDAVEETLLTQERLRLREEELEREARRRRDRAVQSALEEHNLREYYRR